MSRTFLLIRYCCVITVFLLIHFCVFASNPSQLSTPMPLFFDNYKFNRNESWYNKVYAKYSGDIYIAGLFSMHHMESDGKCGSIIEQDGLQVLAAAIYGIKEIEKSKILPLKLGLLAIDTCQSTEYVLEQSKTFLQFRMNNIADSFTCSNGDIPQPKEELENFQNVFGVFGAGNSDVSISVSGYLKLINLPQLSFFSTSYLLSDNIKFPTFFRTIPSDIYLIKAIIKLLKLYNWNYLLIVNDDSDYSKQLTSKFTEHIAEDINTQICVAKTFMISKRSSKWFFRNLVEKLKAKVRENVSARIVLTILTQPKAEDFFEFLSNHSEPDLDKLLWIATDSWGGRNWSYKKNSTSMLKNTIAVVPKAHFDEEFKKDYINRLPSIIDSDPWLAEAFENACNCQYKNRSLFIYLELEKIRPMRKNSSSCQDIEGKCAEIMYKNFRQMLYIHYVIDGIFAYAHTLKALIPENCTTESAKKCVQLLFKNGILNTENITKQLKNVTFPDSTGELFQFWNGTQDGIPRYSIVNFDKTQNLWFNVGSITEYMEFHMNKGFDEFLKENYKIPNCNKPCGEREARTFIMSDCCWKCHPCLLNEIISTNNISSTPSYMQQTCKQCPKNKIVENNTCIDLNPIFMSFGEDVAVSLILINMLGLIMSLISCTIIIVYWKTPIIRAFGRETSTIILVGTILSFSLSIILLQKPTKVFCYLRWCAPGICNTVCYAAILAKTNRIARIFGIKFSSKNTTPRFISPVSQINIVLIITIVECSILTVIMLTSFVDVKTYENNVMNCTDINTSSLVAMFLIPSLLLIFSTVYAFKIRKTPDGFNETRNINFLNFTNCVVLVTCLLLHQVLKEKEYSVIPFCILLTLGGHGNLMGLFIPKIYIILFRPTKNTIQAMLTKTPNRSQLSFSHSPSISSGLQEQNTKLTNLRCRKCNSQLVANIELNTMTTDHTKNEKIEDKSKSKVNFIEVLNIETNNSTTFDDFPTTSNSTSDNKTYIQDQLNFT